MKNVPLMIEILTETESHEDDSEIISTYKTGPRNGITGINKSAFIKLYNYFSTGKYENTTITISNNWIKKGIS